jgi:hypothetical protein
MKTNLEKWNHYLAIINAKTNEFINSQKEGKTIPMIYYIVYPIGRIAERTIIDVEYSHYKHNGKTHFSGKKPTKKEVEEIAEYSAKEIPLSIDNIYFKYSEIWDKENNRTSTSSVKFTDIINEIGLFHSLLAAEIISNKVLEENRIEKEFKEEHKKDGGYNYTTNGYKFLGWQNGWKHEYYDEDGKLCSETRKPHKSFGYSKENYPEYRNCIDLNHRRIEVSHNSRGSENTVSCPICKIYWKYDCSD